MDKKQIAGILSEMGTLLELKGANPFKSRAFHNASVTIGGLAEDLQTIVETGTLLDIRGIGKSIAEIITDLVTTGTSSEYQELRRSVPPGLLDMLRIPGLGPKRVKVLYDRLKLHSVEELQRACEQHRLAELDGFGRKTEENILRRIERLRKTSEKRLYSEARGVAEKIMQTLSGLSGIHQIELAGSLRRKKEVVGDIDIVASTSQKDRVSILETFVNHPEVDQVIGRGETKASVALVNGMNCDLRIVGEKEYPFALNYFTGSKEHNVEMRSLARKKGWSLNEYGFSVITAGKGKKSRLPRCRNEAQIYEALDLSYVPPELREQRGEFEAAQKDAIPELIEEKDLRGTFHCHTTFSDGANTLEEMTRAAESLGWEYWGVADHSKSVVYAGGMSLEAVKKQHALIDQMNGRSGACRIFKGTECDILSDGTLDYPDGVLSRFEYVVAAIHGKLKMTEGEATKRIIKALKNRYVTFLGHPTGRLLLSREGYPVNVSEIIDAASDYGKGIEINAHPIRLDLDWRFVRYAKEKRVKLYINPDAHTVDGLRDVTYGVGIARKGWLEASDVVNTWTCREVERFFMHNRS